MEIGLIVEAGDVREVHHVALLIGYGAAAVNPYLAMETVEDMVRQKRITGITPEKAVRNLVKALGKGVLKVGALGAKGVGKGVFKEQGIE
jgi:glutamate synthase (NADPH/NADH) large chain